MNAALLNIDLDSRLAVNPTLVLRIEEDDCGLLFDPDSGTVQMMNETAISVWQQLDGIRSLRDVLETLRRDYVDLPADAEQQVLSIVKQLADLGAVGIWAEV